MATPNNNNNSMSINNFLYKHQAWLPTLGMVFLTFNSITAVYRSINEPWTVLFIVSVYVNVVLLLSSVRIMERTPEGKRDGIKATVWSLASSLTVMFSYRVAQMMPFALAVIVWLMASVTVFGGFYALVVYREEPDLLPFRTKADDNGLSGEPKSHCRDNYFCSSHG
ncbi:MFS general substrate transporter domain-containing protein [Dioscorea alata]|uniref:MFS general substrate transporter domain-containing protein n=1 Tax=Dioscorea alata TaxID=55571 RepID=A0ACB7UAV0_DIOAL|nr:MFS general substrate transporter domain-containing protein [Dioscorea alata]